MKTSNRLLFYVPISVSKYNIPLDQLAVCSIDSLAIWHCLWVRWLCSLNLNGAVQRCWQFCCLCIQGLIWR